MGEYLNPNRNGTVVLNGNLFLEKLSEMNPHRDCRGWSSILESIWNDPDLSYPHNLERVNSWARDDNDKSWLLSLIRSHQIDRRKNKPKDAEGLRKAISRIEKLTKQGELPAFSLKSVAELELAIGVERGTLVLNDEESNKEPDDVGKLQFGQEKEVTPLEAKERSLPPAFCYLETVANKKCGLLTLSVIFLILLAFILTDFWRSSDVVQLCNGKGCVQVEKITGTLVIELKP